MKTTKTTTDEQTQDLEDIYKDNIQADGEDDEEEEDTDSDAA